MIGNVFETFLKYVYAGTILNVIRNGSPQLHTIYCFTLSCTAMLPCLFPTYQHYIMGTCIKHYVVGPILACQLQRTIKYCDPFN